MVRLNGAEEIEKFRPKDAMLFWLVTFSLFCMMLAALKGIFSVGLLESLIFSFVFIGTWLLLSLRDHPEFWHKYTLWVGGDQKKPVHYVGASNEPQPERGLMFRLPLGGWFKRPAGICEDNCLKTYWHFDQWTDLYSPILRDNKGDKLHVDVWFALRLAKIHTVNLDKLVYNLVDEVDELRLKNTQAEEYADKLRKSMLDAVKALADSSRVGKSKEGKRIHDDLILGLAAGSPERSLKGEFSHGEFNDMVARIRMERASRGGRRSKELSA
jgi:hypothetical protein